MPKVNLLYDVEPTVLTLCKQGANRQRIFLKKEQEGSDDLLSLPAEPTLIKKAEGDSWSTFYCVVAEPGRLEDPGVGDGHGGIEDMWRDEEEIRKAAHFFAKSDRLVTGLHDTMEPFGTVVENALAHADFMVTDELGTEQTIKKGSWYVCIEPSEEGKRKIDAGEFTGLSLEGTGYREVAELRKTDGRVRDAFRALGRSLGLSDGSSLHTDSGTVSATTDSEDDDVDEAQLKKAVEEAVEEKAEDLQKEVSATSNAINKLTQLVENLATSIGERQRKSDEDEEPSKDDLKKAIDGLGDKFAEALDTLEEKVDALADDASAQHADGDRIRKQNDNPLAGLLD